MKKKRGYPAILFLLSWGYMGNIWFDFFYVSYSSPFLTVPIALVYFEILVRGGGAPVLDDTPLIFLLASGTLITQRLINFIPNC